MNYQTNSTKPSGNDFHFQAAQAAGEQKSNAELDLFAEELPEQHDLLKGECVATTFTAATAGGTVSTVSTYSSFS